MGWEIEALVPGSFDKVFEGLILSIKGFKYEGHCIDLPTLMEVTITFMLRMCAN